MRLHNRQIKASFWTDTELIQALPPTGRLFYIGLFMLADDSGCLEDDLLAMKILLFPGDESLQVSALSEYRKVLVRLGKLTPYLQSGKACLFLKNFHKHQVLKTPAAPTVPLPGWIRWEPYESNKRVGKYVVDWDSYNSLTCNTESSYESLTPVLQSSSNLEPRTRMLVSTARAREGWDEIMDAYMQLTGGTPGSVDLDTLDEYYDSLGPEMVLKAFEVSQGKARQFRYVAKVLERWQGKGFATVEDIERDQAEFQASLQPKPRTRRPQPDEPRYNIPDAEASRRYLAELRGEVKASG